MFGAGGKRNKRQEEKDRNKLLKGKISYIIICTLLVREANRLSLISISRVIVVVPALIRPYLLNVCCSS